MSIRERSRWDRRHRRQSRDGKRRASREASEFQIRVSVPQKNEKKACHLLTHPIKPWESKKEKVLTRFWRFSYKRRFTLKIHLHH